MEFDLEMESFPETFQDQTTIITNELLETTLDAIAAENGAHAGKQLPPQHPQSPRTTYSPPENFSLVTNSIYRSSCPRIENFPFLQQLKLKSILILISEDLPPENNEFIAQNNINLFRIGMSGNKEPFVKIPNDLLTQALEVVLNPENQPILVHCNRGKHRTGCLIGCIRKLQDWSLTMILEEYRRFAAPKIRPLDQQFIELYDSDEIEGKAYENGWLPLSW